MKVIGNYLVGKSLWDKVLVINALSLFIFVNIVLCGLCLSYLTKQNGTKVADCIKYKHTFLSNRYV